MTASRSSSEPSAEEIGYLVTLFNHGQFAEAEAFALKVTRHYPRFGFAWKVLGAALKSQGRNEASLEPMRKAAELLPGDPQALTNLGVTLKELGRLLEAETCYQRALKINPGYAEAHSTLGNILKDLGRLDEATASYRRALEINPDYIDALGNMLATLSYAASDNSSRYFDYACQYGRIVAGNAGQRFTSWSCELQPERLRVGLVSADLNSHPVGYFLKNLLTRINRSRIELFAYSNSQDEDELTSFIKPYFSSWKSLVSLSDEAAASLIRADGIHLLLDLSGHSAKNRLPLFAWKPAPVQVSWLGYFATTGVAEMDYLLADEVGVSAPLRSQFVEKVWYLPDTRLCFSPPDSECAVSALPALKNGHITFGCFQNLAKIGDEVLSVWREILNAVPEAVLRLQCKQLDDPKVLGQLVKRMRSHGIEPARLSLFGSMPREAYLAAHSGVDLLLDTFPYPGGTTTCEALWMGVPTLTLAGDSLISRQGASILSAAGLPEWVVESRADYIARAVTIANDLPSLVNLRAALRRQVLASPLFDASRFAVNFEDALWQMWEQNMDRIAG
jgi:predicted O-linked N-acetylglucosamine transferase (SPINDLY family)